LFPTPRRPTPADRSRSCTPMAGRFTRQNRAPRLMKERPRRTKPKETWGGVQIESMHRWLRPAHSSIVVGWRCVLASSLGLLVVVALAAYALIGADARISFRRACHTGPLNSFPQFVQPLTDSLKPQSNYAYTTGPAQPPRPPNPASIAKEEERGRRSTRGTLRESADPTAHTHTHTHPRAVKPHDTPPPSLTTPPPTTPTGRPPPPHPARSPTAAAGGGGRRAGVAGTVGQRGAAGVPGGAGPAEHGPVQRLAPLPQRRHGCVVGV
jgi:hypothetical protein